MKRLCLLLIAYCLFVLLFSCKQKTDYSKEISQLDSILVILTEKNRSLCLYDTTLDAALLFTQTDEKLAIITEKIKSDTLNKTSAIFLSDCYEANNDMRSFVQNKDFFSLAFDKSKERIENLKHDLKEDLIEQNKAHQYIVNELKTAEKLCTSAINMQNRMTASYHKLDSLREKLAVLADSLQSK